MNPLGRALFLCFVAVAFVPDGSFANPSAVLLHDPADPAISFSVWFKAGSQNDPPGKEGLANLTAQMLAQGSTTETTYEDILERLYPIAASYNVRVDREMITLRGRTHKDNVELFLGLFEDAYLRPAFKEADFDRIKSNTLDYLQKTLRYASDEELGKAALYQFIFAGTPYRHPHQGTVEGVKAVSLDDVRAFYGAYFTKKNTVAALGGGYTEEIQSRFTNSLRGLPEGRADRLSPFHAAAVNGRSVVILDKPGADTSISFGFPISVARGSREYYALWLATSWLGEHRNGSSHLFQVIREIRGLNYGDYAYIEAYPEGGRRSKPPTNVGRRHQIFEVWIRTLPNHHGHFALRAALRELTLLVDNGLTAEQFEETRKFLSKYILHFAPTTRARLGYALDDVFYGIKGGHLERFRETMGALTLDEVNRAITKHLQYENVKIAIVTGEGEALKKALITDEASPITYPGEKPEYVLEEDKAIAVFPLDLSYRDVQILPVDDFLQR